MVLKLNAQINYKKDPIIDVDHLCPGSLPLKINQWLGLSDEPYQLSC